MIKYEGPVGLEAAWVGKETIRVGGVRKDGLPCLGATLESRLRFELTLGKV